MSNSTCSNELGCETTELFLKFKSLLHHQRNICTLNTVSCRIVEQQQHNIFTLHARRRIFLQLKWDMVFISAQMAVQFFVQLLLLLLYNNDFVLSNKKAPQQMAFWCTLTSNIAKWNALGCQYLEISSANRTRMWAKNQISLHLTKVPTKYLNFLHMEYGCGSVLKSSFSWRFSNAIEFDYSFDVFVIEADTNTKPKRFYRSYKKLIFKWKLFIRESICFILFHTHQPKMCIIEHWNRRGITFLPYKIGDIITSTLVELWVHHSVRDVFSCHTFKHIPTVTAVSGQKTVSNI